ncbi:alpha-defensin 1-like [Molossus molossus]|uniref:Defensin alpha 5 n=1 Tax=Molossus molossus TaxID=27622 RepID=A0A7J8GJB1_MOLMO|nr:alpha-defensin 1-like [Molossus molossus]KAF6460194.1 defensin alpha 5 [Molossus molossus]
MRTLVLLAALLLVAFQARAQRLQETADQVPARDQPEAKDQDQLLAEDQDMAITFTGEERLTREASALQKRNVCTYRASPFCRLNERYYGSCWISGRPRRLCCR